MGTIDDGKMIQIKGVLLLQVGDRFPHATVTRQLLDDLVAGMESQVAENHGIPVTWDDREGDLMVGWVDKLWIGQQQEAPPYIPNTGPPKVKVSPFRLYADVQIKRELLPADHYDFYPTVCCVEERLGKPSRQHKRQRMLQIRLSLTPGIPNRWIRLEPAPHQGGPK